MGLLDDAIREHLDLKRRAGADPSEVARQEHEALGPARRTAPSPADPDDANAGEGDDDLDATSEELNAARVDEPLTATDDELPAPVAVERDPPPAARAPADDPADDVELPPVAPAPAEHDADPDPPRGGAASPEVLEASGAPDGERDPEPDVLDETPEFLQETPEHDRLWFEQRPPRDFDFDG